MLFGDLSSRRLYARYRTDGVKCYGWVVFQRLKRRALCVGTMSLVITDHILSP